MEDTSCEALSHDYFSKVSSSKEHPSPCRYCWIFDIVYIEMVYEGTCFEIGTAKQTPFGVHRKTTRLKLNAQDKLKHGS
jgi:hypothetical protein